MTHFPDMPYERPNFEDFKVRFDSLLAEFNASTSAEAQSDVMSKINASRDAFDTAMSLASVRHSIDTQNEFYKKERDFVDQIGPLYQELNNHFYKALVGSTYRKELEEKWGPQLFRIAELGLKCISPEVVEELQQENALCTEYSKLLASAKISFDGKELNLAGMVPYQEHIDRDIRRCSSG